MKKIWIVAYIVISCIVFFQLHEKNYEYHKAYRYAVVQHPESLPDAQAAKFTSV